MNNVASRATKPNYTQQTNKEILISVIVPIYNVEKYLERCLNSLVNQTLKNIEIICINDGSSDTCLNILKVYKEKDDRIKIIDQENQGVSVARNNGIAIAQGEYIAFVDGDDYVDLGYLEIMYNGVNNSEEKPDMVQAKCFAVKNLKKKEKIKYLEPERLAFHSFFWTNLYKNKFLKDNEISFPKNILINEDSVFELEVKLKETKVNLVNNNQNNCYYHYILRENSATTNITTNISNKYKGFLESIKIRVNLLNKYNDKIESGVIFDKYMYNLFRDIYNYTLLYRIYENYDLLNKCYKTIKLLLFQNIILDKVTNKYIFIELLKIKTLNDLKTIITPICNNIYIFNRIKLLTIYKDVFNLRIKLFNILPILEVKDKWYRKYIRILKIPIFSIIGKIE